MWENSYRRMNMQKFILLKLFDKPTQNKVYAENMLGKISIDFMDFNFFRNKDQTT